jgi:hypothetical protein
MYRGEQTYVNIYGSNFTPDSTISSYTNGGMSITSGLVFGSTTNVACYVTFTQAALLGGNHLISVQNSGGHGGWIYIYCIDRVPRIDQVDNTTLPGTYDYTFVRGTTAYTHFWGQYLWFDGITGTCSGTGVTLAPAANGNDTIIAMNVTVAADAPLGTRTMYLTTPGGGQSNSVTVTIVAPTPTISSITGYANAPPQGFLGIKRYGNINGTGFSHGPVTVNSSGVAFADVSVVSDTQLGLHFTGTAVGAQNVTVTTAGGASNAAVFTVLAVTALPSAGMVVNHIMGGKETGHPGTLGAHFTVGSKDRLVTHLGRWKFSDSTKKHDVVLLDDQWQIMARATVDLSTGAADSWIYTQLPTPILVKAGKNYLIHDQCHCSLTGDPWANVSSLAPDGNATINGITVWASLMSSYSFTQVRSDSYCIGLKFVAGAAYGITALGRYKNPGNTLAHRVILKDAAGQIIRSAIIDFTGGKGIDGQFNYSSIPYMNLTTGNTYYLLSDEQGGDTWHQYPCMVTPWGGLTNIGYAYEAYPGQNGLVPPTVGAADNQVFTGIDILCLVSGWSNRSESHGTFNLKWLSAGQPVAMII